MRKLLTTIFFCFSVLFSGSEAYALGKLQGFVEDGGRTVSVGGITSTTKVQRSYPAATVTVYTAGTLTLATLYSDSAGTAKANPFTADSTGFWFFYAGDGDYDVRFSGSSISSPFTRSGLRIISSTSALGIANVKDYGAKGDSTTCLDGTDDTLAFQRAAASGASNIDVPPGVYRLTAKITFTRAQRVRGPIPTGGSAFTGTNATLCHAFSGNMLEWTGTAATVAGAGGGIEDIQLMTVYGNGAGGGSGKAISLVATSDALRPTWFRVNNVQIEPPAGAYDPWSWCFYSDGTLDVGATSGVRDVFISNIRCAGSVTFNPATPTVGGGMGFIHTQNAIMYNVLLNATGAFTDPAIYIAGSTPTDIASTYYIVNSSINGTLYAGDYSSRIQLLGGNVINITDTANAGPSFFAPAYLTGSATLVGGPHILDKSDGAGNRYFRANTTSFNVGTVTFNVDVANTPSGPALVNGANNNVSTLQSNVLYVTAPTGAWNITGLANGVNGKEVTIINLTGQVASLIELSASSSASNRISNYSGGDVVGWKAATLRYIGAQSLWFVVSTR